MEMYRPLRALVPMGLFAATTLATTAYFDTINPHAEDSEAVLTVRPLPSADLPRKIRIHDPEGMLTDDGDPASPYPLNREQRRAQRFGRAVRAFDA